METPLAAYLAANNMRQAEFGRLAKLTQATVSRLAAGQMKPSLDVAVRIERLTRGQVPAESWIPNTPDEALAGENAAGGQGLEAAVRSLPPRDVQQKGAAE